MVSFLKFGGVVRRWCPPSLLLCLSVMPPVLQAADPLPVRGSISVEAVVGEAWMSVDGARSILLVGDAIPVGAQVTTGPSTRLNLRLARHGRIDLGQSASLLVAALPFADPDARLRTEVQLHNGTMRVAWRPRQMSTAWPMYVGLSNLQANLASGEYFFTRARGQLDACVASGQMHLDRGDPGQSETLRPAACYAVTRYPAFRSLKSARAWTPLRLQTRVMSETMLKIQAMRVTPTPIPQEPVLLAGNLTSQFNALFLQPAAAPIQVAALSASGAPLDLSQLPIAETVPLDEPGVQVDPLPFESDLVAPVVEDQPMFDASEAPAVSVAGFPPSGLGRMNLVAASFVERAPAQSVVNSLVSAGYPAIVAESKVGGSARYRVRIDGYDSSAQVQSAIGDLDARLGLPGAWLIRE